MEEFLQSKPMLTPGIAGMGTTLITGTVVQFLPVSGDIIGIVVSFLIGTMIWADKGVAVFHRAVFYVLNSITIFAVASGINEAGVAWTKSNERAAYESRYVPPAEEGSAFFRSWF